MQEDSQHQELATPPPQSATDRRRLTYGVLLIGMTLCAWGLTIGNDYVYDDHYYVSANKWIESWENLWPLIASKETQGHLTDDAAFWRPLRNLVWTAETTLLGKSPKVFHTFNLLWHSLAALGLYLLLLRLRLGPEAACVAALIFALHPAQSESVAWIKERDGLMSGAFLMWALVAATWRSWGAVACSLCLYALALLSKESAVVYVAILPAVWWVDSVLGGRERPLFDRKIVLAVVMAISLTLVFLYLRHLVLGRTSQIDEPPGGTMGATLWTMCGVFLRYLQIVFVPVKLELIYHYLPTETGFAFLPAAGMIVMLFSMAAVVWAVWRRRPWLALGLLWFLVALLPYSNIIPMMQWMAVRFLYVALAGAGILVGALIDKYLNRTEPSRIPFAAALILIIGYLVLDVDRSLAWENDLTLWRDMYYKNPANVETAMSYADHLTRFASQDPTLYEEALEVLEDQPFFTGPGADYSPIPWRAKLIALHATGRVEEAFATAEQAREHFPTAPGVLEVIGFIYVTNGDLEAGIETWETLLEHNPYNRTAMSNLAVAYTNAGEPEKAAYMQERRALFERTPVSQWPSLPPLEIPE